MRFASTPSTLSRGAEISRAHALACSPLLVALTLLAFPSGSSAASDTAKDSIIPKYEKINQTRKLLNPEEIAAALIRLPGWKAQDGTLTKTFVRKNFLAAIAFINAFAPECERLDHHPEIFSVYNKVVLTLTTFDAGQRISSRDVELAERIEVVTAQL